MKLFVRILISLFIAGLVGAGGIAIWLSTLSVPDLASFSDRKVVQSTKIYDRTGDVLLYETGKNTRRTIVDFSEISHHAKNATIAIEDQEFYEHVGIKPTAILRAVLVNLLALEYEQGGSTITQQVVKNTLLTNEKTIPRKLKEWVLALKMEQQYNKEDILGLYLNEIPYGGNIYGIEEAAQTFFDKPASELTLPQAAYLAALPKAPTYYSPYGNHRNELDQRKNLILERMEQNDFITETEYENARNTDVTFEPREETGIRAPHFVFYVIEKLEERFGRGRMQEEGFRVTTTLDWELQQRAQKIASSTAHSNEERFEAENASIVAVDPKTGEILTMVGSRGYFDEEIDGSFNVALAERQPGSAFKPFAYAQAFAEGYTPQTILFDTQTQFASSCDVDEFTSDGDCYSPVNYSGTFHGPVTMREALAQSINVPSVKTLYLAGLNDSLSLSRQMGIQTLEGANQYGLTLVLGGGEVRPLDIASAYGVFATGGIRHSHTPIKKVTDSSENIVYEQDISGQRVLSEDAAAAVTDVLSDNEARAPLYGNDSPLHFPERNVASKTGTTNEYKDAWTVGYSPHVAVAAWAGNNDNTSMKERISGLIVTPMWREFMDVALENTPEGTFSPAPSIPNDIKPILRGIWLGNETYTIDTVSGKRATEHTPEETKDEIVVPDIHTILHWIHPDNPRGAVPENPQDNSQYEQWEYGVREWVEENNVLEESVTIPDEYDDVHTPEKSPSITLEQPVTGSRFSSNARVQIRTDIESTYPITSVEYRINGNILGSSSHESNAFSFVPQNFGIENGTHTLTVIVYDEVKNRSQKSVSITIE